MWSLCEGSATARQWDGKTYRVAKEVNFAAILRGLTVTGPWSVRVCVCEGGVGYIFFLGGGIDKQFPLTSFPLVPSTSPSLSRSLPLPHRLQPSSFVSRSPVHTHILSLSRRTYVEAHLQGPIPHSSKLSLTALVEPIPSVLWGALTSGDIVAVDTRGTPTPLLITRPSNAPVRGLAVLPRGPNGHAVVASASGDHLRLWTADVAHVSGARRQRGSVLQALRQGTRGPGNDVGPSEQPPPPPPPAKPAKQVAVTFRNMAASVATWPVSIYFSWPLTLGLFGWPCVCVRVKRERERERERDRQTETERQRKKRILPGAVLLSHHVIARQTCARGGAFAMTGALHACTTDLVPDATVNSLRFYCEGPTRAAGFVALATDADVDRWVADTAGSKENRVDARELFYLMPTANPPARSQSMYAEMSLGVCVCVCVCVTVHPCVRMRASVCLYSGGRGDLTLLSFPALI